VINELPRSRPVPVPADQGVTHREISWRAAVLRRALPALVPPRWLDPLLLLLVAGYLLGGIAAAPYTLEEAVQGSLTADAGALVTHPQSVLPGGAVSATQESVRLAYGSLTRYATAAGWYAAGGRAAQIPMDLTVPGPSPVHEPERELLVAARAGPAVISVLGVLVIFLVTRRMLGRAAALVAVLIFGLHPTVALVSRQSADAGLTMSLGLAAILVAVGISGTLGKGAAPGLGAWTGLAVLTGLALASGPSAPPYVAGAAAFCLAGVIARQVHRRREAFAGRPPAATEGPEAGGPAGWLAVTALGAVLVWVLVSPAFWGWLPERLETRHRERPTLIAQRLLPDPGPADAGTRLSSGLDAVTDPFLSPTRPEEGAGLSAYRLSWWSGLPVGERGAAASGPFTRVLPAPVVGVLSTLLGMILTAAAALGAVSIWRSSRRLGLAVAGWGLATVGWLVLAPSRQADHATPLIALACVLVAAAAPFVLSYLARLARDSQEAMDLRGSPDSLDFLGTKDPGAHRAKP
jgi:hypothetical protein